MNCHNSEKYLSNAVESIIQQSYIHWELIFWDNRSIDKSSNIIKSYSDKRIKYYLSDNYTTLGEARNLALSKANGEFIAFLDCDDLWTKDKLKHQIPLFEDPEVGIVISNTLFFNEKGGFKKLYTKNKPPSGYIFRDLLESYFISLETAIIRKKALPNKNNWFDKRFQIIEEFDLFLRMSINYKLLYVDEILGKWRVDENSWTWKRKDLYPKELRILLKKLTTQIPKFNEEYKDGIQKLMKTIIIQEFLNDWATNHKKVNRKEIRTIIKNSKKGLFLYLISFVIDYKIFDFFNQRRLLLK